MPTRRANVAAVAVTILIAAFALATIVLAEGALHPPRRALPPQRPRLPFATAAEVSIAAADGARLEGWLFTPTQPNGSTVLALHGIGDNRASMTAIADALTRAGYEVLAPDARAHGTSGGSLATYGVLEADDVRRWIAFMQSRTSGCVYGFGESLGAALLLQSLDARSGLCALVAESAFTTFAEVAADRVYLHLPLGGHGPRAVAKIVARLGLLYVRLRYGVDLARADPAKALASSRVPVLLVHGTADLLAPVSYGERLSAARPGGTSLWVVAAATHTQAWAAAGGEFPIRVLQFFALHR